MAIRNSAVENRGPAFDQGDMEGEQIAQMFGELTKLIDKMNAKKSSSSSNVGSDRNFQQTVGTVAEFTLSGGPSFSSIAVSAEKHPDDEASKPHEVCEASKYEESIAETDAVWSDLQQRAIKVMQRRREKRSAGGGEVSLAEHQSALKRREEMQAKLAQTVTLAEHRSAVDRIEVAEEKVKLGGVKTELYEGLRQVVEKKEKDAEGVEPSEAYQLIVKRAEESERMLVIVNNAVGKYKEKAKKRNHFFGGFSMDEVDVTSSLPKNKTPSPWLSSCLSVGTIQSQSNLNEVLPSREAMRY